MAQRVPVQAIVTRQPPRLSNRMLNLGDVVSGYVIKDGPMAGWFQTDRWALGPSIFRLVTKSTSEAAGMSNTSPRRTVLEFPISEIRDMVTLKMPAYAALLSVTMRAGIPILVALVDAGLPMVERRFRIVPTGEELMPELLDHAVGIRGYVGSFNVSFEATKPAIAFHVFAMR